MKDKNFIEIIICFAALSAIAGTFAYDVTSTCKIVKSGTYISDPVSCSGWVYCENGEERGRGSCNPGLYYNVRNGRCDYAANVDCRTNLATMCEGLDKVFKPNPNDCSQYCYCSDGKATCQKCPDNQIFDAERAACVWKDEVAGNNKCIDNSPCQLVANNQFVKHEKNCSKYYRCLNGVPREGECALQQNFNHLEGRCDWAKDYTCSSSPSPSPSPSPGVPSRRQPQPNENTCNLSGVSENHKNQKKFYVDDKETCRGTFVCSSENDRNPPWTQCPLQTHFILESQECVRPIDANCQYDRCDGLSVQFVTLPKTNCKKFALCQNGAKVPNSDQLCKNVDYQFFDEVAQACVPTMPEYEICK